MESISKQKASEGVSHESSSFMLLCCQPSEPCKTAKFQSSKLGMTLLPLVMKCNYKRTSVMQHDVYPIIFYNTLHFGAQMRAVSAGRSLMGLMPELLAAL